MGINSFFYEMELKTGFTYIVHETSAGGLSTTYNACKNSTKYFTVLLYSVFE